MAIKGAFQAGLIQGFATSFAEGIKERQKRFDELVDSQMDTVRRNAPKMAQSMAEAKNADLIRQEMKAEFGVTDEEFLAIAQNYDVTQVYGAIQKAQENLPEGAKLDKSQFLGSLDIPKGITLPEGMTAEQALENIYLGYARNVSADPENKSEGHKSMSWGRALKDTLMLDPRSSVEDHMKAMSYMGIPVQDVLAYEAATGGRYEPLPSVKRVKGFDIETTDYKESDYMTTANTYERTFTRTFAGTDDLANATNMEEALDRANAKDKTELGSKLRKGGIAIADLELALSQSGVNSQLTRDQALLRLSKEVNTSAEMDNLLAGIENGLATELILESLKKNNGKLTDDYIEYILTGTKPERVETEPVETKLKSVGAEPVGTEPAAVKEIVETILSQTSDEKVVEEVEEVKQPTVTSTDIGEIEIAGPPSLGFPSPVEQRRSAQEYRDQQQAAEDKENEVPSSVREAASKITYAEYKAMSRKERREAGLPERPIDGWAVFGVLNPQQYFKGGPNQIDVGDITEETKIDRTKKENNAPLAKAAVNIIYAMKEEFSDMSVLEGEDGKQIIIDFMKQNNLPLNEVVINMIHREYNGVY
jgi:hypothetical protein